MICLQSCRGPFPFSEEDISTTNLTLIPNDLPNTRPEGIGTIRFTYTRDDLPDISDEDLAKVEIKFHVEPGDNAMSNFADNLVSKTYYATIIKGTEIIRAPIPRPVGKLSIYSTRLQRNQRTVCVDYTASDVSGIYYVIGEAYYEGNLITAKTSTVYVRIPNLYEFSREGFDNMGNLSWKFVGQTEFHVSNNYLQYGTGGELVGLILDIRDVYKERCGSDFIVRITDGSLPWGGMFWIGYTKDEPLTINDRVDNYGNVYSITYMPGDNRIYAPPHKTHREGRNVDISIFSDDGYGNKDTNRYLYEGDIKKAILRYNESMGGIIVFTYTNEGDHYHITCHLGKKYYE